MLPCYPREFLSMDRADVGAIGRALGHLVGSENLIFWLRDRGALGGKANGRWR